MKKVNIDELQKEFLVGLNGLIEKAVDIQKQTEYNTEVYREALSTQIKLEKIKLDIMNFYSSYLDSTLTEQVLVGYDIDKKPIYETKELGDARFVSSLTNEEEVNPDLNISKWGIN